MALIESELTQLEHIPTQIYSSADAACKTVADAITQLINERNAAGKHTILGLATGSTPEAINGVRLLKLTAWVGFKLASGSPNTVNRRLSHPSEKVLDSGTPISI